MSKLIP